VRQLKAHVPAGKNKRDISNHETERRASKRGMLRSFHHREMLNLLYWMMLSQIKHESLYSSSLS